MQLQFERAFEDCRNAINTGRTLTLIVSAGFVKRTAIEGAIAEIRKVSPELKRRFLPAVNGKLDIAISNFQSRIQLPSIQPCDLLLSSVF